MTLTIAPYLWHDPYWRHNDAFTYSADHVRHLRDMVAKNISVPYEFACITDRPDLFRDDDGIRAIPLDTATHVPGTEFAKLMTFHPNGRELIGTCILQLDLDTVIVGNIDAIVSRTEDLVVWRNPSRLPYDNPVKAGRPYYNGSVILHRCGTRPNIWSQFNPRNPRVKDTQVWMSMLVGPAAPYWDGSHGIYRLARADTPGSGIWGGLPGNATIVNFVGSEHKPWVPAVRQANPWIAQHWPEVLA
jgi:hypothetical protein